MPLRRKIAGCFFAALGVGAIFGEGDAVALQSDREPKVVLASYLGAGAGQDAAAPRIGVASAFDAPAFDASAFDATAYDDARLAQLRRAGATAALLRGALGEDGDLYLTQSRLSALGGFGDALFGREDGVADMLAIAAPNMFTALSYAERSGDLGFGALSLDGPQFNALPGERRGGGMATLFPGAQIGVAYRPDAADCVDGLCLNQQNALVGLRDPGGVAAQVQWDDIMEVALFYERAFGNGFAIGLSGAYVTADEESGAMPNVFDSYEAYSVGANLAFGGFSIGGNYRLSNGGFSSDDDNYVAYDAGIAYEAGPWGFMVGYGNSDAGHDASDPLNRALFRQTQSYQTGVTYMLGRGISIGLAGQFVQSDQHELIGGDNEAAAIVFESSINF